MRVRRGENVGKLEREIEMVRASIADTEAEQARQDELAEQATSERRAAADDPAAYAEITARVSQARDERVRLGFVLDRRRNELVELEAQLERARYDGAYGRLEQAGERRQAASTAFAKTLTAAVSAAADLAAARDAFASAVAHARELCPRDVDLELPAGSDEAEFPDGVAELIETLGAGPRRPIATNAKATARWSAEVEAAERARAAKAVDEFFRWGDAEFDRIERLSPAQLEAAVGIAERRRDEEVVRLERSLADAPLAGAGARTRQMIESLDRRVERIRELADAAKVAA